MMTAVFYLRAFFCALLILSTHGFPTKGSKPQDQSGIGTYTDSHSASYQESPGGYYSPMSYSPAKDVQVPSSSQFVRTNPASGNFLSGTLPAGYSAGYVPVVPVQFGYAGSTQASPPETEWAVAPKIFDKGVTNDEALSSNDVSSSAELAAPVAQSGPVFQSGETSSVQKDAELGNFKHETETVGYPAGLGFPNPIGPYVGPWFYPNLYPYPLPYPYPQFDYRLLYGLYPPGIYTTFNKQHEKGKDYYQNIHYLKEHGSAGGSVQQKKIYPYGV